ncbi:hypothetical protein [Mycolicibacterium goodii]|uniref:hypothetical protein n=1 Tax=Mycolicibacterium goodii TaxID=134601 RepID=UPI001BDD126E|nr:hypothetical protein [Mycolicibacterium goodii]MBU8834408.1 hypothetical protein [Mycolicibacterium goodii]
MTTALQTDVLVRAWTPDLSGEGARFKAVLTRQPIAVQLARVTPGDPLIHRETRSVPGLIVIAPSAGPTGQNAVDVAVRGIADMIKLTILQTPELLWQPIEAHRDELQSWRIHCIPFTEWLRLRLGDTDPETARSDDGW